VSKSFLDLVKRGDTQEIADWVKDDPRIAESRDAQGVSALLWAVYSGQTVVRDFLRSGLELDLSEAAAVGDAARLRELLGPDPAAAKERANSRSADGWPLLHLAAAFADRETVVTLLDAGAEVDQISQTPMRNQALHALLALSKDENVARLLIEHGADKTARCDRGKTPAEYARERGHAAVTALLED
jgi:ankyrin repeat protein